jgi:hypothetical protein
MIPKVMKERRRRAYTIIQKFMRGYKAFNDTRIKMDQFRLVNNFKYFSKIRNKLLIESQKIIRFQWMRHIDKK